MEASQYRPYLGPGLSYGFIQAQDFRTDPYESPGPELLAQF